MRAFPRQPRGRLLARGAVGPDVGHGAHPVAGSGVEIEQVGEPGARPRVLLHVVDAPFDPPLGPWPIRLAQAGGKAEAAAEVEEGPLPDRLTRPIPFQDHELGVVVEAGARDAAEGDEGAVMAAQKRRFVGAGDELDGDRPRPAEHHDEDPDRLGRPVVDGVAALAEVDPGLRPRVGLEPHRRPRLAGTAAGLHVILEDRVAAGIALRPQFPQQHHAVGHPIGQSRIDAGGKRVEARAPLRPRFRLGHPLRPQIRPHRVPGDPRLRGDAADRRSLAARFVESFHEPTS